MSTPIRRTRSGCCCARAASGQITAVPLRSLMNSRRLTRTPYRLISRARELRPVTSRQMIADFEMLRDTLANKQRTREGSRCCPCARRATVFVGAEP